MCYSCIGTLKINNKLHFHRCFSHNKIFLWFYLKLSLTLQGSEFDVLKAFPTIGCVKQVLQNVRSNIGETFASVNVSMTDMARLAGLEGLTLPR